MTTAAGTAAEVEMVEEEATEVALEAMEVEHHQRTTCRSVLTGLDSEAFPKPETKSALLGPEENPRVIGPVLKIQSPLLSNQRSIARCLCPPKPRDNTTA